MLFCERGTVQTVEARQFRGQPMDGVHLKDGKAFVISAVKEAIAVNYNDWIVTDSDGRGYYPIEDRDFRARFQPVPNSFSW